MNISVIENTKEPVLILGATGTGKSVLAKRIHNCSTNSEQKFIHLNIASVSHGLFESTLFGHCRGSFTGAILDKPGFCEVVGRGTLFIDEIGELSLEKQAKLLTLIDERSYYPVGSTVQKKYLGRLIFATNKDLDLMVKKREFREDLLYRIRFFSIKLKELHEQVDKEKIIINEIEKLRKNLGREKLNFSCKAIDQILNYTWPGNYRELENTLKYLYYLNKNDIHQNDLPEWLSSQYSSRRELKESKYYDALRTFEKAYLENQLKKFRGKINLTAQMIGISKVTLISKLKKYDINRSNYKLLSNIGHHYGIQS